MSHLPHMSNKRGNAFLSFLFFLIMVGVGCYIVYNNPDFQKSHRREIFTAQIKYKEFKKTSQDFINTYQTKFQDFKKSHHWPGSTKPQVKTPTFNELIYDPDILNQEIPTDMIRHQPDEITLCSFDAQFLLNNTLSKKEVIHLANIFRFCDLSSISDLNNKVFISELTELLKLLHYNAVYSISPAVGTKSKTYYTYLFRNDRISALKAAKLIAGTDELPVKAYEGQFKAGKFDFTLLAFQTPPTGIFLSSTMPLENTYEAVKEDNKDVQDIIMFGNFSFQSASLNWDNGRLLPTVAGVMKDNSEKSQADLIGNFWFRKKDLTEFNGHSGTIDIKEDYFPSAGKPTSAMNKPVWAQFKLMSDDD